MTLWLSNLQVCFSWLVPGIWLLSLLSTLTECLYPLVSGITPFSWYFILSETPAPHSTPNIKTLVFPRVLQGPLSFLSHPSNVHPASATISTTSASLPVLSQAPESYFDCFLNIFPWMSLGLSEATRPNEFIIVSSTPLHLLMSVIGTSIHSALQSNNLGFLNSLSHACQHLT